jgi:hypothetical protein
VEIYVQQKENREQPAGTLIFPAIAFLACATPVDEYVAHEFARDLGADAHRLDALDEEPELRVMSKSPPALRSKIFPPNMTS